MGVKSSKQSYNVEQVGQNVKSRESLRKKDAEEKQLAPISNDLVIEEIISAAQKNEQAPRLSKEEQLKEEELIIAKVRGEIIPSLEDSPKCDVTPKEDLKSNNVNDLDAITVIKEEISESVPIVTVQNILEAEKARDLEAKRISISESKEETIVNDVSNEMENFETSTIEEINTIICTNKIITPNSSEEDRTPPPAIEPEQVNETPVIPNTEQAKPEEAQQKASKEKSEELICNEPTEQIQESTSLLDDKEIVVDVNENRQEEVDQSKTNVPLEPTELTITSHLTEKQNTEAEDKTEELNSGTTIDVSSVTVANEQKEAVCNNLEKQNGDSQLEEIGETAVTQLKQETTEPTPKEVFLQQIRDVEKIVNGLKEKILHFTGTAQDKEFSVLHEELIKHIIKLDDIAFEDEEVMNERRRVIKMIQRCVQNLERKLEQSDDDHHTSDSE